MSLRHLLPILIIQGYDIDCQALLDDITLIFYTSPSPINNNCHLYLMKCTGNGVVCLAKEYGGPETDQSSEIFVTSRDQILLPQETDSCGEGRKNVLRIKTNLIGTPVWIRTSGDYFPNGIKTIFENPSGFILRGTSLVQQEHIDYERFTIKFDPIGIPIR